MSIAPVTLEGGRVRLVPYAEHGWPAIAAWNADPGHQRWFDWPREVPTGRAACLAVVAGFQARWREGRELGFMVEATEVVGWCSIQPKDAGLAEVSYGIVPAARGRGFAVEAVRLATAWALEALALERLQLRTDARNAASRAVARAAGFREEAVMRSALAYRLNPELAGTRGDLVMHAVVR